LSGRARVICCKWTPNASSASPGQATRSQAIARAPTPSSANGSAGSSATRSPTVTAFVERALQFYAAHDITPKRLQTDNAWCYAHNNSLAEILAAHQIHHRYIPPRTPKRNGKVERYQQTLAREWAYGQRYRNSDARATALPVWLNHYNTTRNHSSLSNRPPISRVRNQPRHDT